MSDLLDTFQKRHQEKLEQLKRDPVDEAFLDSIALLIGDLRQAGAVVADPIERSQLRALARFWGNVVYDHQGIYPDVTLQPPDPTRIRRAQAPPSPRSLPPLNWILAGGAATIVIAAGLAAIGWLARGGPEARPVVTPAPIVSQVAVGTPATDGTLIPTDVFCAGTLEIAARFTLKVQTGTPWHWEVWRAGTTVIGQTTMPWKEEDAERVFTILTDGAGGIEPGQYNLLLFVGDQMAEAFPFRVLATPPRITNLRVSDVPEPTRGSAEFAAGVRVLYLTYDYEGMCPGLKVVHTLYRDGQPLQESVETWSDPPTGSTQVSFQTAGDEPFPPGKYEATVTVAGAETARMSLLIQELPAATAMPPSPAFGNIIIALGVQPDGTPIITAPGNVFDWNTKIVYAIFDYSGMGDGMSWAAVWQRNGQEVARQEGFWDVESAGMQGRRWVAYYDPRGMVLPGGAYSVTLAIANAVQRSADFQILFYVPRETAAP